MPSTAPRQRCYENARPGVPRSPPRATGRTRGNARGATAAESLTGTGKGILSRRGRLEETTDGAPVFLTSHPSYLLRLQDRAAKAAETERFQAELRAANEHLERLRAA